jgi:ubiquitin carboxyl-terminal hydrolase 14
VLKFQLFSLTGVEPDRQSLLIKGGKLKDNTDLSKIGAKPGGTFTLIGSASGEGSAVVAPTEKPKFLEDLTEAEAAKMEGATPAGLQNLGNTCYLNSTLQVLKSMPELQEELALYKPSAPSGADSLQSLSQFGLGGLGAGRDLVAQLRDLYQQMSETQDGFPPMLFLNTLRQQYPQFDQRDRTGRGYAQQDAEEAYSQIVQQLSQKLTVPDTGNSGKKEAFVKKYMSGTMHASLAPPAEVGDNEPTVETDEPFLKLNCHIDNNLNHLTDGIKASLTEEIEKNSETLGRDAIYTKTSRVSRLPKYLTVHFVRFFWKKDINKKAKILKKVTFPEELDVVDYCTEDLRKHLIPVRDQIRNIRKDEQDMERARKRQKLRHKQEEDRKHDEDMMKAEAAPIAKAKEKKDAKESKDKAPEGGDLDVYKTDKEYEEEKEASLKAAKKALLDVIDPELAADEAANKSGLYELRGVITHQGASADSGHYTSYVKKEGKLVDDPKAPGGKRREEEAKWWWFNDDKVSEVDTERVLALSGGGEAHSALILLYRAIDLPTREEVE